MKKITMSILVAAIAVGAYAQEAPGSNVKPYKIVFESFQVQEVGRGMGSLTGETNVLGTSKGRMYSIRVTQTQFFRVNGGTTKKLSKENGLKLLRPGTKLAINGLMNPATAAIRARTATILSAQKPKTGYKVTTYLNAQKPMTGDKVTTYLNAQKPMTGYKVFVGGLGYRFFVTEAEAATFREKTLNAPGFKGTISDVQRVMGKRTITEEEMRAYRRRGPNCDACGAPLDKCPYCGNKLPPPR